MTLAEIATISKELWMAPPEHHAGALDIKTSAVFGRPSPDIMAIDAWCHKKWGYTEEEHGSLNKFLELKFPKTHKIIEQYFVDEGCSK